MRSPEKQTRKQNRGPSAGPANKQALIDAARIEFRLGGGAVPLSRIARRAGVGQGSLYRHFPDRAALATAVFEANLSEIEGATKDSDRPFSLLLDIIERQAAEASALIEIVAAGGRTALQDRLRGIVADVLRAAQAAGEVQDAIRIEDLLVAVPMLALTVAKTPAEQRRDVGARARLILEARFLTERRPDGEHRPDSQPSPHPG